MKRSFTTSDGRTLSYNQTGTGPLLVCHAGGPGFTGATLGDLGGLGGRFELVVLDPRGTGSSTVPAEGGYRQEDYIADLEELRLHLGLEEFDLLGHSHGGFVAMSYAGAQPQRVRRLALVATAPRFAPEYDERVRALWEASLIQAPTLLITGDLDFFGPPANEDMRELVPDARSVVLSDAGHFVWFDEPDRFREEVTRFLLD